MKPLRPRTGTLLAVTGAERRSALASASTVPEIGAPARLRSKQAGRIHTPGLLEN